MQSRQIGHAIIRTSNAIRRCTVGDGECFPAPATAAQNFFLGFLYRRMLEGVPVYQRDLEAEFSVRRSTASGILSKMEQNGLLRREPDQNDARRKSLVLTDAGAAICKARRERIRAFEQSLVRDFTEEERDQLLSLLQRVYDNVGALCGGKGAAR